MAVGKDFKNVPAVHNRRPLLLLAVATFLAVLTITAVSYEKAGHATGVNGDPNLSDGIRIHADIQKISPTDDQLVVGLQFEPRGRFAQDGVFLAKNVRVVAVGGAGLVDESFAAGGLMTSQTLPVALETGDISQYPFDRYTSLFSVRILTTDGAPVPTVLLAGGSVHGYSIGIGNPRGSRTGQRPDDQRGTRAFDMDLRGIHHLADVDVDDPGNAARSQSDS